ncbi:MAG: YceI family protein [Pseudomonadota bacterium]
MRTLITLLSIWLWLTPAGAEPSRYLLDIANSNVGFNYSLQGAEIQGTMRVAKADITVDLTQLSQSQVNVTLDATRARAGNLFATEAMRGTSVLDVKSHPEITFSSTRISGTVNAAQVTGNLRIRGVSRPVTLNAQLLRQPGTQTTERNRLAIRLTGTLNRNDFGATGYPNLVGPNLGIDILAFINRAR